MEWEYIQDVLSLLTLAGASFAGIYLQLPIPWEHFFFIMLAGFGALAMIVWFILGAQI